MKDKFTERWLQAKQVTAKHFVNWGKQYAANNGINDFKASHGWVWRFAIRERLSNRAVTTSGHTMPSEGKANFEWWLIELHEVNSRAGVVVGEGNAANMEVPARNTGHTKLRFTAQLCVMDDGLILDPLVVFKALRKVPAECKNLPGIVVCVTKGGSANRAIVQYWAKTVWDKRPRKPRNIGKPSHLTCDSFAAHKCENFRALLKGMDTELTIVPPKLTPFCNVLDAVVIKVFKGYMRELYGEWVEGDEYTFTAGGNYRKPPYKTICEWVIQATALMNQPENRKKWAKGFPVCGWNYIAKGSDPQVLGRHQRSLLLDPVMEGYATLPSVQFAKEHNARLAALRDNECGFGSDWDEDRDGHNSDLDLDNTEILSDDSDNEVEDSAAILMTQRLTQALNDPEMLTPTPEEERVPIITQPHRATRMTVTKKTKNSGRGSHKGPCPPNAVAGQQSIVSAFQKQSAMPTIHTPNTSTAQMQKECTTSPVNVENSRCCSKGCGQRLESWGRGPDSVKFCHFCGRRCHVRCVAKSQHECDTEHFNAK